MKSLSPCVMRSLYLDWRNESISSPRVCTPNADDHHRSYLEHPSPSALFISFSFDDFIHSLVHNSVPFLGRNIEERLVRIVDLIDKRSALLWLRAKPWHAIR